MMSAALQGHVEVVRLILGHIESTDREKNVEEALVEAATFGYSDLVGYLLKNGGHLGVRSEDGRTLLMLAAERGQLGTLELLLDAGSDVRATSVDGATALMLASTEGHNACADILLRAGSRVDVKRKDGDTALMLAAYRGRKEAVRLLLDSGAKVNNINKIGETALHLAAKNGSDMIARLTSLSAGGSYRPVSQVDIVKILLDAGANVDAKTKDGRTALNIATENGEDEIAELLNKASAEK